MNLAQYYVNSMKRTSIDDLIKQKFTTLVQPTENHRLLAQLPISTFWTTNYDKLIERALENNMKNASQEKDEKGNNPFDYLTLDGEKISKYIKCFDSSYYQVHMFMMILRSILNI